MEAEVSARLACPRSMSFQPPAAARCTVGARCHRRSRTSLLVIEIFGGTGRFEGAVADSPLVLPDGSLDVLQLYADGPATLDASVIFALPALGGRFFLIKGVLDAQSTQSSDSSCASGTGTDIQMSGHLENLAIHRNSLVLRALARAERASLLREQHEPFRGCISLECVEVCPCLRRVAALQLESVR